MSRLLLLCLFLLEAALLHQSMIRLLRLLNVSPTFLIQLLKYDSSSVASEQNMRVTQLRTGTGMSLVLDM